MRLTAGYRGIPGDEGGAVHVFPHAIGFCLLESTPVTLYSSYIKPSLLLHHPKLSYLSSSRFLSFLTLSLEQRQIFHNSPAKLVLKISRIEARHGFLFFFFLFLFMLLVFFFLYIYNVVMFRTDFAIISS